MRGDIEGLRAVAVLLVMLYHAGVSQVPGGFIGVDVFFVVSGFVITAGLLRELESTGRVRLLAFYGRRAKRLLPAAGLVLLVTAIASWLMVSRVQWQHIGEDIVGAAVYVVNWVFAGRSVDYLAEDIMPSPVLHYWSLAVEEQFYLIWPVVLLGLFAYLRRAATRRAGPDASPVLPRRQDLAIALVLVLIGPSLLFSVIYSLSNPEAAFFITPTRLWELGVGGLIALAPRVFAAWQHRQGAWVAWAGILLILASAYLADRVPHWPGIAAAVPVVGTALVIAGGFSGSSMGPARILELRPLVWVGGLSYSLYLWHWPLLRFWEWRFGEFTLVQGVAIVAFSFVPAWLSYRFVESPVRFAKVLHTTPRYALSVGFNCTLVALVAGLLLTQAAGVTSGDGQATGAGWSDGSGVQASDTDAGSDGPASTVVGQISSASAGGGVQVGVSVDDSRQDDSGLAGGDAAEQTGSPPPPGLPVPEAEQPGDEPFFETLTPDPVRATGDVPELYDRGCQVDPEDADFEPCVFGDPEGEVVVAVVGDSKIAQWMPALDAIAQEQGWLIRSYTKSSCAFAGALTVVDGAAYHSCQAWGQDVLARLTGAEKPVAVITSGGRLSALPAGNEEGEPVPEALVAGYVDYWTALEEEGIGVIAISDTQSPVGTGPVYECVEEHRDDPSACSWSSAASPATTILQQAASQVPQAHFIDMDPWVCPGQTCVGVYRNVLTYRQGSHITATFVGVLTEPLAAHLVPLIDDLEAGR